jgi:hypothetical protein
VLKILPNSAFAGLIRWRLAATAALTLLAYSEAANVYLEVLVKYDLNLPETLPSPKKSEGVRTQPSVKSASKSRAGRVR